eukprot:gene14927-17651_t
MSKEKKTQKRLLEEEPVINDDAEEDEEETMEVAATTGVKQDIGGSHTSPIPHTSPFLAGYAHGAHNNHVENNEADTNYFNGRRIICDTSSSDVSGGEGEGLPTRQLKKKKKLVRREGKIFELLEQRLGSEALRNTMTNPTNPMDWPFELVLVRHGQSEGNEAQSRSKKGDLSAYTPEFKKKHSSTYRLTDKGILQAKIAGKWVRENVAEVFDRYYTSEYVRAMETASLLGLDEAKWLTEIQLRERDKGKMDNISWTEKNEKDQIHNTSILWYTRVHPKTGEIFPYFKFLRSVCPWKPEYSAPGWLEFDRPIYTNEELMESVRTVPRFVNNPEKESLE